MSLKARDIHAYVKKHGAEKGLQLAIMQLAEEQSTIRQTQAELAEMFNSMADSVLQMTNVAGVQKDAVTQMQKTMGLDDGLGDEIQSRDG